MEYLVELAIPNKEENLIKYSNYNCKNEYESNDKKISFRVFSFKSPFDVIDLQIDIKKGNKV